MEGVLAILQSPGGAIALQLGTVVLLLWVIVDGKRGRGKLHKRLDEHEDACNARNEVDARWRGRVSQKLDIPE